MSSATKRLLLLAAALAALTLGPTAPAGRPPPSPPPPSPRPRPPARSASARPRTRSRATRPTASPTFRPTRGIRPRDALLDDDAPRHGRPRRLARPPRARRELGHVPVRGVGPARGLATR